MKNKIIISIFIVIACYFLLYLSISFINLEIDFRLWSAQLRAFFVIFGAIISLIVNAIYYERTN